MQLATFVDQRGDTIATRTTVRESARAMVSALTASECRDAAAKARLLAHLRRLASPSTTSGRLLDLVGICQCLAQQIELSGEMSLPSLEDEHPAGTGSSWELYAQPGDVRDWETVLILSGCTWRCTGGGQRPVQLAKELVKLGHTVVYCGAHNRQRSGWAPGVLTCSLSDLQVQVMPWLLQVRGTVIMGLPRPEVVDCAEELAEAGWRVIYDCIDDWEAFARSGYWADWSETWERRAVFVADLVTASAQALCEKVTRWHPRAVEYLPNAGGGIAPERTKRPPPDLVRGKKGTAIYVGAVDGPWLDWQLVERARGELRERGIEVNIIGGRTAAAEAAGHCLGEKPFAETGSYLAWSDVALIPFRNPVIAKSVDPIKYYDYRAAGLRIVATEVLTELTKRRGVRLVPSDPAQFAAAVVQAAERGSLAPTAAELRTHSWRARAQALERHLQGPKSVRRRAAGEAVSVSESDCVLRVSWDMTAHCNLACPYCSTEPARRGRPAQPQRPSAVIAAWHRFRDAVGGPMYLSVDFGEPMATASDVEIIAELARYNKVDVVTNLKFGKQRLGALPRVNGNVAFACSYHPHAWKSLDEFIAKYEWVKGEGYTVGVVAVVAWPPYLADIAAWVKQLRAAGVAAYALPFQGLHDGREYPQSYSAAEHRLLAGVDLAYEEGHGLEGLGLRDESPEGRLCETGHRYVYVHNDGTIVRCPYDNRGMGNLFAGEWSLRSGRTPCQARLCVCPDLWKYVVTS